MENKYTQQGIIDFINNLKGYQGYQGYVQMSDSRITDIWAEQSDINLVVESGFVYEAHFCNGAESIAVRQINGDWLVATTDISDVSDGDKQTYHAINGLKVKMAQIWEPEVDPLCEKIPVMKLKKVVFAGFEK